MNIKRSSTDLESKLRSEKEFHDKKYAAESSAPAHYKYNPTYKIFLKLKDLLNDIRGKRVLEYGCGNGWLTAELISMGASVEAFDVSSKAVQRTQDLLKRKVTAGHYRISEMPAEQLTYEDNNFDIAVGFAILHHLDLDRAMPELYRVLRRNGVAYFAEPLGTNPFLNLYRKLTPKFRTPDEKPIVMDEFRDKYARRFSSFHHMEFYLMALVPLFLTNFPILSKMVGKYIDPFFRLDEKILYAMPFLGKWAWYSIICLKK